MGRYDLLRTWMRENCVTFRWTASKLGMTDVGVARLLQAERISVKRHAEFAALGFPQELLPRAEDYIHKGRPPMVPMLDAEGRILQVLPDGHDSTME